MFLLIAFLFCLWLISGSPSAQAADVGVGQRTVAIAEIDPLSAVTGSTAVSSLPSQLAEPGPIEIREVQSGKILGKGKTANDGQYKIDVRTAPLAAGQLIQAVNTKAGFFSSGVKVATQAPPVIDGPLTAGTTIIRGRGTPGHRIQIVNAITESVLGEKNVPSRGDGRFVIAVPPLPLFHSLQAVDVTARPPLRGKMEPVLNLVSTFSLPPRICSPSGASGPRPQIAAGFVADRFHCQLPLPRGVAVDSVGNVFVVAGTAPSDPKFLIPPLGVFRFIPPDGQGERLDLSLFATVTGVTVKAGPGGDFGADLFVARPRVFNIREKVIVERGDGEIFAVKLASSSAIKEVEVFTRLLEIAPTGIAFDTTPGKVFAGDMLVSSFLGDKLVRIKPDKTVATLVANLRGLQGLAVSPGGAFGTDLYAAQPGSGRIVRITPGGMVSPFVTTGLVSPVELAFGPGGAFGTDLYVTDVGSGKILQVKSTGHVTTFASGLRAPFGLAFRADAAALFISGYLTGEVARIVPAS